MRHRLPDIGNVAVGIVVALALLAPTVAAAHPSAVPAWRPMASLPLPSDGLAATRLPDGSVLAVGGAVMQEARSRMAVRYDPAEGVWQRLQDAPVSLDTPALMAITLHEVLVVAPSFANGSIATPSKALLFDPFSGRWTVLPPCPVPLFSPRLVSLSSHVIVAGGGSGRFIGALFRVQSHTWTAIPSPVVNLATYTLAALPQGDMLLVAGAAIGADARPYEVQRAFVLNRERLWHEVAPPLVAVDGAQAVNLDGRHLLVAGGYPLADDPHCVPPPALVYDTLLDRWQSVGSSGPDHRGAQLIALGNGTAILVGGHGPDGQPSAATLLFDGSRWQPAPALPGRWSSYALVSLADGGLLLIGGDRPSGNDFVPVASTLLLALGGAQG